MAMVSDKMEWCKYLWHWLLYGFIQKLFHILSSIWHENSLRKKKKTTTVLSMLLNCIQKKEQNKKNTAITKEVSGNFKATEKIITVKHKFDNKRCPTFFPEHFFITNYWSVTNVYKQVGLKSNSASMKNLTADKISKPKSQDNSINFFSAMTALSAKGCISVLCWPRRFKLKQNKSKLHLIQ